MTLCDRVVRALGNHPNIISTFSRDASRPEATHDFFIYLRRPFDDAEALVEMGDLYRPAHPWTWVLKLFPPSPPGRTVMVYLPTAALYRAVGIWADPDLPERQRWERLAELADLCPQRHEPAPESRRQTMFRSGSLIPTRRDGRFESGGIIEPYPGAWDRDTVAAVSTGDWSTVWPLLTAQDER